MRIKLKHLALFLAFLTLGNTFLPIVFSRLPFPFSSGFFYLLAWLIIVSIFDAGIFLSKYLSPLYLLGFILFIGGATIWVERDINFLAIHNPRFIMGEILSPFLAILIYLYFIKSNNTKGLAKLAVVSVVFIFITAITSIVGLQDNPKAVREMAASAGAALRADYTAMGIANYNFFGGIIYLFPVAMFFFRKSNKNKTWLATSSVILIVVFYSLVKAQFTTALALALFFFLLSFFVTKRVSKSLFVIAAIGLVIFAYLNTYVADVLYWLSTKTDNTTVVYGRLIDLGDMFLYMEYGPESGDSYFARARAPLSYIALKSFLSNPLIGGGEHMGHAHWLDRMATFGIIGFFPYVLFIYRQYKLNMQIIRDDFKSFYVLALMSYVALGILTTTSGSLVSSYVIFLIIPGLSFVELQKQKPLQQQINKKQSISSINFLK